MTAQETILEARKRGLTLTAAGDKLRIAPAGAVDAALKAALVAHKPEILKLLADPWADMASAIASGALHQCRRCRNFTHTPGSDNMGGWCQRYRVAAHPDVPFVCDGYVPAHEASMT